MTRVLLRLAPAARRATAPISAVRVFSVKPLAGEGVIPGPEGVTGVAHKEEVYEAAYGQAFFDRDAPVFHEEGTKENPIPILSVESERAVGISFEVSALRSCAGAAPG